MREFGYLNRKISEHMLDIEEYFDMSKEEYVQFMRTIYKISDGIIAGAHNHMNLYRESIYHDTYKRGVSLEETLRLVLKFFNTIAPELCSIFEQARENGTILFHSEKELRKLQISKDNFYYFYNLAGIHNGKTVVNIIIKNTIGDAFTIIHEFMHYVSMNSLDKKSLTWLHFTEGYSYTFEKLFFNFLKTQPKWKEEAKKYYIENIYAMCLRTFEFRTEFICFDVFLNYGSFTPQKVLKYCEEEAAKEQIATRILNCARISERYLLQTDKTLREYLEDSRYVLALPFTTRILEKFDEEKESILSDIRTLENQSSDYYFDKYDLENVENYQKIFRM